MSLIIYRNGWKRVVLRVTRVLHRKQHKVEGRDIWRVYLRGVTRCYEMLFGGDMCLKVLLRSSSSKTS